MTEATQTHDAIERQAPARLEKSRPGARDAATRAEVDAGGRPAMSPSAGGMDRGVEAPAIEAALLDACRLRAAVLPRLRLLARISPQTRAEAALRG